MTDDSVGYKKPPKKSQFEKGKSGNPSGKKKWRHSKLRDVDELVASFLAEKMSIETEGKKQWRTRQEVLLMAIYKAALKGHGPAMKLMVELVSKVPSRFRDDSTYFRLTSDERTMLDQTAKIMEEWVAELPSDKGGKGIPV